MRRVVLTGASGTVGSALVRKLVDAGFEVTTVSRGATSLGGANHWSLDLADPKLIAPIEPNAILINCAAITRNGFSKELERDNLTITTNALRLTSGPVVHLSSSSVYDLTKPSVKTRPADAPATRFLNSYGASKWQTEQLVRAGAQRPSIILRPHAVYGPSDNTLLPRLRKAVRPDGRLILPAGGQVKHAMTSLDNLCQAILLATAKVAEPEFDGQLTFNITDANEVVLAEAIRLVLDQPLKIVAAPNWLALVLARWSELLTPSGQEPRLSRYAVQQLGCERTYDITESIALLGYQPAPNSLGNS